MWRRGWLTSALMFAACGASPPNATSDTTACSSARDEAVATWTALADRADAEAARDREARPPIAAETALEQLEAHAQGLDAAPREITGDEALAISGVVMDAVDEIEGELPFGLRERADDAAEALLTDRGDEGARRAARDAVGVLEQIVRAVDPASAESRELRRALASLGRRARDAATAYGESPDGGDRRADRAGSMALPPSASPAVVSARATAMEASDRVRSECRVARRVAVPSL